MYQSTSRKGVLPLRNGFPVKGHTCPLDSSHSKIVENSKACPCGDRAGCFIMCPLIEHRNSWFNRKMRGGKSKGIKVLLYHTRGVDAMILTAPSEVPRPKTRISGASKFACTPHTEAWKCVTLNQMLRGVCYTSKCKHSCQSPLLAMSPYYRRPSPRSIQPQRVQL